MEFNLGKISSLNDEQFAELVASSSSYSDILTRLGLVPKGGNSSRALKKRIKDLALSVEHFTKRGAWTKKQGLDAILVADSSYTNNTSLKKRLLAAGMLEYVCSCGNTGEWMGQKLVLQLDHINGIHNDNRIENLRFLCPNCHSQTHTYSGRNK